MATGVNKTPIRLRGVVVPMVYVNKTPIKSNDSIHVVCIQLLETATLKVGSWRFEGIIILLIYFLNCQKTQFTKK